MKMNHTIFLPLLFILIFGGCDDEKFDQESECAEIQEKLIGEWIEKEPAENDPAFDGIIDTLIFTNDHYIRSYFPFDGWQYNLSACDSLVIEDPDESYKYRYHFEFLSDEEIIIYNFINRDVTHVVKNIEFYKKRN